MSRPATSSGVYGVTPSSGSGPTAVNIGVISARPPIDTTTVVSTANNAARGSMIRRCQGSVLPSVVIVSSLGGERHRRGRGHRPRRGADQVEQHQDRAGQVQGPSEHANPVE